MAAADAGCGRRAHRLTVAAGTKPGRAAACLGSRVDTQMAFLRNTWYAALWSQDLAPGQLVARTFLNEPIVLFRGADGKPAALADSCPHRFSPLSKGKIVKGSHVRCPYHALEFDGAGKCVHNPHGNGHIASTLKVRSYPVHEKHSLIWIWMGERDADPALIPDFSLLDPDSGRLVSKRDWILMETSYELIIDNLMDLSHTAVVHEGILGNEQTIKADLTIEQNGRTVSVGRSIPNVPAPGLYDLIYKRDGRNVDLWMDMRWDPPACLANYTGVTEPSAPREQGTGFWGMHFLTPQTEKSTYYLFAAVRFNPISWGSRSTVRFRHRCHICAGSHSRTRTRRSSRPSRMSFRVSASRSGRPFWKSTSAPSATSACSIA